ncbi:MAG: CvpA family protein [Patescibacteria group bacterium]
MSYLDIILIGVLAAFALFGFWSGFLQSVGSIIGTIAGLLVANQYFGQVSLWVIERTGWGQNTARVVTFILVYIVIARGIGLLFWVAEKILRLVPFGKTTNRIAGAALGLIEGVLAIGIFLYMMGKLPLAGAFAKTVDASWIVDGLQPLAVKLFDKMPWLFSEVIKLL